MDLTCSRGEWGSEWLEHNQGGEWGRDDVKEEVTPEAKFICDPAVPCLVETLEKISHLCHRRRAHVCPTQPCPQPSITIQVLVKEKGWVCVVYSEDGVLISSRKD